MKENHCFRNVSDFLDDDILDNLDVDMLDAIEVQALSVS